MSTTVIAIEFNQLLFVDDMTDAVHTALTRAMNRSADRHRTMLGRAVRDQIAFPASYVSPSNKRLWVKTRAKRGALTTVIEGRGEATSLARFTRQKPLAGGARHRGGAVNVTVKPGVIRNIKRAFLMRLKNDNIGLAVRTNGEKPRNAFKPKSIGKNLWLLYGPSVDQALAAASKDEGIIADMTPEMLDFLEQEFNRQMELLNG